MCYTRAGKKGYCNLTRLAEVSSISDIRNVHCGDVALSGTAGVSPQMVGGMPTIRMAGKMPAVPEEGLKKYRLDVVGSPKRYGDGAPALLDASKPLISDIIHLHLPCFGEILTRAPSTHFLSSSA